MVTLYNVISEDGYIARKDGSEDFIPDSYWPHTLNVLKKYDRILIGRKTYDAIQTYDDKERKQFDELPIEKFVVTRDKNFKPKSGYKVVNTPEEAIEPDINIVVTSGPTLNNYLLQRKLVQKVTYHKVSESIGEGIKPYENVPDTIYTKELLIAEKIS
ncbi:MAG: hypothetical protein AAB719_00970 [Patescibacteria group bacterium]